VGACGIECVMFPEGALGKPSLADPQKAVPSVEKFLNYMVQLHDDILERFPVGKLQPLEQMSQRDPKQLEEILKGPLNGGRHLYTLGFPP
jgi:creatinine amidohydrolase